MEKIHSRRGRKAKPGKPGLFAIYISNFAEKKGERGNKLASLTE
jgi:hypothetical protein